MPEAASSEEFEERAAERVMELGTVEQPIDLETFAAMFDLFRVSARVVGNLEAEVHRPLGLSIAGFRVLFTVWVFDSLEGSALAPALVYVLKGGYPRIKVLG